MNEMHFCMTLCENTKLGGRSSYIKEIETGQWGRRITAEEGELRIVKACNECTCFSKFKE